MTASVDLSDVTEATGNLVVEKVSIPKLQGPLVPVPDLYGRLSEGTSGSLTVVRGPAAAGKTALVAAWIASDLPSGLVAWLSLDEHDNEPVAFWTLVVEALRRHGVALPADLQCPSEPGSLFLTFLEELSAALGSHLEPVVLVLDHFDAVTDPRLLRQLGPLLRKAPDLRLVVTTRRPPPAVLGRRRLTVVLGRPRPVSEEPPVPSPSGASVRSPGQWTSPVAEEATMSHGDYRRRCRPALGGRWRRSAGA